MKSKYTQRPWRVGDAGTAIFGPKNGNPSPETIAQKVKYKADAQLISAAPELFEAVYILRMKMLSDLHDGRVLQDVDKLSREMLVRVATMAIDKAEGRG